MAIFVGPRPPAPFSPVDIGGLELWLKADAGITKDDSDLVSQWKDQSGNGNDATQGTDINKPTWLDNQINGHPTINFDGSSNLSLQNKIESNVKSFFISYKKNTDSASDILCGDGTLGTYSGIFNWTGNMGYFNTKTAYSSFGTLFSEVFCTLSFIFSSENVVLYQNNNLVNNINISGDWMMDTIAYWKYNNSYGNVKISEIIIYSDAKNETDRQLVENYLITKYGL